MLQIILDGAFFILKLFLFPFERYIWELLYGILNQQLCDSNTIEISLTDTKWLVEKVFQLILSIEENILCKL